MKNKKLISKNYYIAPSRIHGKGLFTNKSFSKGELIGLAHVNDQPTPEIGMFHNHDENTPTAINIKKGNQRYLIAGGDINAGTEITTNYRMQPELGQPEEFMTPQKDGYRSYSPFQNLPYIDINSNVIDTNNLAYDKLKLIGDNGVEKIVKNNSGNVTIPGAETVREIPLAQDGGTNSDKILRQMQFIDNKENINPRLLKKIENNWIKSEKAIDNKGYPKGYNKADKLLKRNNKYISRLQEGGSRKAPSRKGVRLNYDEEGNVIGESSHIMKTETLDGIHWFSFPTLFQNEDESWLDMSEESDKDWRPAMLEAKKRGELIHFGADKEEALAFGEGSWKDLDYEELELTDEEIEEYRRGGHVVEELPKAQNGLTVSDPNHPRLTSYRDSLDLFNFTKAQQELEKGYPNPIWSPFDYLDAEKDPRHHEISKKAYDLVQSNPRINWLYDRFAPPSYQYKIRGDEDWFIPGGYRKKGDIIEKIYNNSKIYNQLVDSGDAKYLTPYINANSPDIIHDTIESTDWYMGRGANYIYPEPKQEVTYVPKTLKKELVTQDIIQKKASATKSLDKSGTIYTSDPNDPRIKVYSDSLAWYNDDKNYYKGWLNEFIKPIKVPTYDDLMELKDSGIDSFEQDGLIFKFEDGLSVADTNIPEIVGGLVMGNPIHKPTKPVKYVTKKQRSYADAYKNVDKKKYPTLESFIEEAENYKNFGSNTKPESKSKETKVLKSEAKEKKLKEPIVEKEIIKKPEIPEGYTLSKGYQRDGISYGDMWHDSEGSRPAISAGPTMDDYYIKYPKSSDIAIDDEDFQLGGQLPKAQWGKGLKTAFNSLLKKPKIPTVTNLDFSNINNFTQIPSINFKSNVFPLVNKNLSDGITHTLKLSDEIGKLQSTLPSISLNNEYDLGQFKKKFLQNKGLKQEDFKILDDYILDNKLSGEIQPIDLANSIHNDLTFPVNMERIVDYEKSAESFFSTTFADRKKLPSTKLYSAYNAEEYKLSPNYSYSAYSLNTPTIKPIGDKHFGDRQKISSKSDLGSFQTSVENTIGHMRGFENLKDPTHFVVMENQSDVMQAGKDGHNIKEVLHENYSIPHQEGINENKFLKLLQGDKNTKSKDRRWMKLQTNSIVQQLVKEGYTTIDFPLGKLATKTQGHRYTSPNEVAEYKHLNETNKEEIDELNTSKANLEKKQSKNYPKGNILVEKKQRLSTDIVNQHLANEGYVLEDLYKHYKIHPQDPTYTKISDFRQYDAEINKIFNNAWRDLVAIGGVKVGTLASKEQGIVNADKKLIEDYTTTVNEYNDWEQNSELFETQVQDMSSHLRKIGGIKPKLSSSQINYDGSHRKFLEKEFKHWLTETVDEFGYPILRLKVNPDLIKKVNNIKYQQGGELPKAQYGKFLSRLNKNLGTTLQNNVLKKFDINDFRNYSDDFYKNLINSSNEKLTQGLGIKKLPMNIKLEHPGKSGGLINVSMSDKNSPFVKTGELILAPVHSSHDFPNLHQRTATNILLNQKGPETFGIPKFKVDNNSYFFSNQDGLSDSEKRLYDAYSRIPTLEAHTTFDKDKFIDFGNRGLRKEWDAPFGGNDGNNILKGQGLSGEINEAINQAMKERGMSLFSGTTSHSTEGGDRYANLLQKGLIDPITNIPEINLHLDRLKKDPNTIENLSQYIVDNDVTFKYKKEGGEYLDLDLTEDQIKNFKDGGFVVKDLPKAQFGDLLPKFIKGITPKIPKAHQFNIGKDLRKFYNFEDDLLVALSKMGKDPGMPDFDINNYFSWAANLDKLPLSSSTMKEALEMSDFAKKDLTTRLKAFGHSTDDITKYLDKGLNLRLSKERFADKFNMLRKETDLPLSDWHFPNGTAPIAFQDHYRGDQLKSHMNKIGDPNKLSGWLKVKGDTGIPGAFSGKDFLWEKFLWDKFKTSDMEEFPRQGKFNALITDVSDDLFKQWQNKINKSYDVLNASQKELMYNQRSTPFREAGYEPMNKQLMQTLSGEFIENKKGGSVNKFQGGGTKKILSNILKTTLPLANKFENISIPTHPFIKDFVLNNKNLQKPMLEFLSTGITPIQNYTKTMLEELKSPEGSKRLFKQESEYMRKIGMSEEYIDRAANLAVNARLKELDVIGMKNNSAVKAKDLLSIGDPKEIENFLSNDYLYSNASYSPATESAIDSWDPRYFKDRFGIASKKDMDDMAKESFNLNKTRLGIYNMPGSINIGADWNFPFSTPVLAHELRGHGLQRGRKLKIDSDAIKLIKPKKELNESQQEAYNYFKKSGKEPSAFLNELREAMLSNGLIKKRYEYITPQKLKMASTFFKRKPMGIVKSNNRKHFSSNTRILDFMDETPKMFMNLSSLLNRLPSVAGAIGTGAALYNNEEVDTDRPEWNFKKGGSVPTFQDGGGYYYIDPKTKKRVWIENVRENSDRGYYDNKGYWHNQPLILSEFKNEEEFKAAEEYVEKDTQKSDLESSVEFKNEQALKKFKKNYPKKYKNYIANKKKLQKNTKPDELNAKRTDETGTYKDKSVNIYEGSFDDAYNLARYHTGENLLSEDAKDVFGWKNPNTGKIEYKHIYSAGEIGEWSDGTPYVPGYSKEFLDAHPEFVKQVKEYKNFSDEELKKYNIDTEESQKKREEVETFMKDKPEFAQYFKNKKALKDNPDLFNEEEKYDIDQQNEEVYQNAYKEHYSNVTSSETRKNVLNEAKNKSSYGTSQSGTPDITNPERFSYNDKVKVKDEYNGDGKYNSEYFSNEQLKNILHDEKNSYMAPEKIEELKKLEYIEQNHERRQFEMTTKQKDRLAVLRNEKMTLNKEYQPDSVTRNSIEEIDNTVSNLPLGNKLMFDYYKENLLPEDYDNLVKGSIENIASYLEPEFKSTIENAAKERNENHENAQKPLSIAEKIDFAISDPFRNLLGMNVSADYRDKSLGERASAWKKANATGHLDETRGDTWGMATALNAGYWFGPTSRLPMANLAAQGLYDIGTEHIPNLYNEGTTNWGDLGMDAVDVAFGTLLRKGFKAPFKKDFWKGSQNIRHNFNPSNYNIGYKKPLIGNQTLSLSEKWKYNPNNPIDKINMPTIKKPILDNKYFHLSKQVPIGFKSGGEYDLTDSQIKKLEQDGYEIEYM